jgi:soluble lytic murein transglycosylase-like protein
MPLMRNDMSSEGPRLRGRLRVNNETRAILRSRPLQLLLVGVAAAQGVSVATNGPGDAQNEFRGLSQAPRQAPARVSDLTGDLTPVVAVAPARAAQSIGELSLRPAAVSKPEAKTVKDAETRSEAEVLAEKYRRKGFKVSPALAREIYETALANDIEPAIAFGLVKTESGFKNSATSHVGAMGLTQLMPATARWLEPGVSRSELRDTETNLRIGFRYLRDLIEKYDGNTDLALTAYNRGPGTVDRALRRGRNPDNGYAGMVRGTRNSHK